MTESTEELKPVLANGDKPDMTFDSFSNIIARLGMQSDGNNLLSQGTHGFNPITRQRLVLEWAYRGSSICKNAVDIPANDMFRTGITMNGLKPEEIDILQKELTRLQCWKALTEVIKWGRLYGGSLAYFMVDGQDPASDLNINKIGKGQFKGILPLSRWQALPSTGSVIMELGPDFGLPLEYQVTMDSTVSINLPTVNSTRVTRCIPVELPYYQRLAELNWGLSVLETLWDRLIAFDSVTMGAAQLAFKAHLRILKIKDLRQITAAGGDSLKGLQAQIDFMRATQSNESLTIIDGDDEFQANAYSFGGFAELIDKFAEQISGALQIPLTRLMGVEPGGLGSNGESGFATYYDMIASQQENLLRHPIQKMLELTSMSVLGKPLPEDFSFTFNPLFEMDSAERADIESKDTATIISTYNAGLISLDEARSELRKASDFSNLFRDLDETFKQPVIQEENNEDNA